MYGIQPENKGQNSCDLCGLHPYSLILQENGINLSDKELFALLQLFSLECYFVKDGIQMDELTENCDSFCLTGIASFSEKKFNNLSKIFFYKINVRDNEDVLEKMNDYINLKRKLIVFADVYYLKYHPLQGRYHSQTQIMISGGKEAEFYIEDYHLPTFPISSYEGWISKAELISALLLRENSEQTEESGIVTYSIKENFFGGVFDIKRSVKENFEKYLSVNFNDFYNIKEKIINSIHMIGDLRDEKMKKKLLRTAYTHITGRAGLVISRRIMAEVFITLGFKENKFFKIADMWQGIAGCFFRLSLKYFEDKLDEVCFRISEVIDLEYKEINQWRKNLEY